MSIVKNLLGRFIMKDHYLILEEEDVTKTLITINKHHKHVPEMKVANCGWGDSKKWFIRFRTTETKWRLIRKELTIIRVYENSDIPENTVGVVYSTD